MKTSKSAAGFMLLEAILAVVIVSVALSFITQSLLTNFRTAARFQELARSTMSLDNRLGLLYATDASPDQLDGAQIADIDQHLKKITLQGQGHDEISTVIYKVDTAT